MPSDTIFYTVEFRVADGKLEQFTKLAELHSSSDSMLAHVANVGPLLGKLLEVSALVRLDVFKNPNEKATEVLKGLGARINGHFDGFTR